MTRFYYTDTQPAISDATAQWEVDASSTHTPTNSGVPLIISIPAQDSNVEHFICWTSAEQPHNSSVWPTTGWGFSTDVSSVGADISYRMYLVRGNSDGSSLDRARMEEMTSTFLTGTGIQAFTAQSWSLVNGGTGKAVSDRLYGLITASNTNMMSAQSLNILYSDSDCWIEGTALSAGATHQITASGSGTSGGSAAIQIVLVHLLTATGSGTSGGSAAITAIRRLTATGSGTSGGSAAIKSTLAISATGSGVSGGSAALRATLQITATGSGTSDGSAAISLVGGGTTHQLTSTGSGTSGGSASIVAIRRLTATGTGTSSGSAALSLTARMTASGSGSTGGSAALRALLGMSATGAGVSDGTAAIILLTATVHQLSAEGSSQSGGSVVTSVFHTFRHYFSPPTHEEPIRTDRAPVKFFRLTHAPTVLRRDGTFIAMRTPPAEWLTGEAGKDFFIGGHEYEISEATKTELQAAGFSVTSI